MKDKGGFLNSTGLFVSLLLSISAFGFAWVRAYAADNPPVITGVDWSKHPKSVLLLVPAKDCGCGMKPLEMARNAAAHHVDFVIASAGSNPLVEEVRHTRIKGSQVLVDMHISPELIKRYCVTEHSTALRIENGHVRFQIEGNLPEDFFDNFKEKL